MATDLDKLIQEIRSLPPEDKRRVREALAEEVRREDLRPTDNREMTDEEYQELLVQAGLLKEVRPRHRDQRAFERLQAVEVVGEPLSETIIRERR